MDDSNMVGGVIAWEGEVMLWKMFVAFVTGMRLAARVATVRRAIASTEDSPVVH